LREQRQQQKQQQQSRAAAATSRKQEDEGAYFSAGAFNGNFWLKMSGPVKSGYVSGFAEAIKASSCASEDRRLYAGTGNIGDRVRDLDLFYRDAGKRDLPIWLAMHWLSLRAGGTPEDEVIKVLEQEGFWRPIIPEK
jgi:hypothetical protein